MGSVVGAHLTGFIAGGLIVARVGLGSRPVRFILIGNLANWTVTSLFALRPSVVMLVVGMYVWVVLMPMIEAAEQTVLQRSIPFERQGRVFGFAQMVENAAAPITAIAIGPLAEQVFIPFMTDGAGVDLIGEWFGTGPRPRTRTDLHAGRSRRHPGDGARAHDPLVPTAGRRRGVSGRYRRMRNDGNFSPRRHVGWTCSDESSLRSSSSPSASPRCSTDTATGDPVRAIVDARTYYDDYSSPEMEDMSATAGAPNVNSAAAEMSAVAIAPPPIDPGWPDPDDDNVFVDVGDSAWTTVDDDRESTFGLDVDTGSFMVGRAQLDAGSRPEPDSIRIEEWVNAFDLTEVEPSGDDALGMEVEVAHAPHTDDGTRLVRVGIGTADLAAEDRPAANITFVIDTSGSMDIRERLGLVQSSLALLVNTLRSDDTISIVTYGDDATALLPPTPISEAIAIVDAIDSLLPSGSTNMESGLRLGYEMAREAFRTDGLNVVVLASDGVANMGSTDPQVLIDDIAEAGDEGISLVTVGYGMGNYNDHLMEQLADRGDGFYRYLNTFEDAETLFVDDFAATLTIVAGDAKSQVVFDDSVVEAYRLIGYENRALDDSDFRDDTVDAGELGAGHEVTALYEVRLLDAEAAAAADPLGELRLRWTVPGTDETLERETAIPAAVTEASPSLRLAAVVAGVAEVLRGDDVMAERGVSLTELADDADALVAERVAGAEEIAAVIAAALAVD